MLRVGFFQFSPLFGMVQRNLHYVIEKLKNVNADLIVLPELPFTGYQFKDKAELNILAEDSSNSPTIKALCDFCAQKNMVLVTGFAEKQRENIYNASLLLGSEGLIHIYRKIQLFYKEKDLFTPGNLPLQVHEVLGVKIGMMICFDWIFPEVTRVLALQGADIICHPSNLVLSYCQEAMITRCLENNIFTITANRFGTEKRPHGIMRFTGRSQIVAPKGKLVFRAKAQREELFITEIDPFLAKDKRITEENDIFQDRRPEFYNKISEI